MASVSLKEHLKQAQRNEEFYQSIKENYPDWGGTALFYSALHYVDAFLMSKNVFVKDHKDRFLYIEKIVELRQIHSYYRRLYDYSINTRYNAIIPNIKDVEETYKRSFLPFKKFMEDLLQK
ncbi:MAG: hypothetical protein HQL04_06330 [Nitrospirae bacterium]|nr:hypothetical protein [Nitrospirota bacterium]